MTIPPRQTVSPLNYRVPIVDPTTGMPTLQFIQLLQKLTGNVDGADSDYSLLQTQIDALDAEVTAAESDILALQVSAVPPGGALGEVLTKDSSTDYDMSWQPSGSSGGSDIYAPLVNGDLPGPVLVANITGECIMVPIG